MQELRPLLRNRPLWTIMSGHFAVDHFSGLMPVLYPLLVATQGLTIGQVGLVAAAYQSTLSLTQPLFGHLADRIGTRWLSGLSVVWMAIAFAGLGWARDYGMLVALAAAAGLGSGAYHPQGAMNAALVTDPRQRNTAMAIYTLGGTGGVAIGPIVGAAVFGWLGKEATLLLALPALAIGIMLLVQMRVVERRKQEGALNRAARAAGAPHHRAALVSIVGALMIRGSGYFALTTFLTVWFQQLGHSPAYYSVILTTLMASAVVGTFVGGLLADRLGRRRVMLTCLFALGPLMFLFVQVARIPDAPPLLVAALAFCTGFLADAPFPLALVTAQRLMPGQVGMASGLILGFTFSAGGFGALLVGQLANQIGLAQALSLAAILPVVAAFLFLTVPPSVMAGQEAPPTSGQPAVGGRTSDA